MPQSEQGQYVIIVAPIGDDATAMTAALTAQEISAVIARDLGECVDRLSVTTGALLLTEEALELPEIPRLNQALLTQPRWSEIPIIVLTDGGESRIASLLELTTAASKNVTILERPVHVATLVRAVQVALSSRARQFQVRDLLEEQAQMVAERARRSEELARALDLRTQEVIEAQHRLATSERMASIGTMAAGLSHDINNILLPLSSRLDSILLDQSAIGGDVHTNLTVIVALIDHLRQMSRNLSLFARDPEMEGIEGTTDIAIWWSRVQSLFESSLSNTGSDAGHRIRLKCDLSHALPTVAIAPHRLTQAVLNLVHNARDAIATKIQSTSEVPQAPAVHTITIQGRLADNGSAVCIRVIDEGCGMSEETRRRSIEPFFTTKDRHQDAGAPASHRTGSGLGLSLVHRIVERVGGRLEICSEPATGTTITLTIPTAAPRHEVSIPEITTGNTPVNTAST